MKNELKETKEKMRLERLERNYEVMGKKVFARCLGNDSKVLSARTAAHLLKVACENHATTSAVDLVLKQIASDADYETINALMPDALVKAAEHTAQLKIRCEKHEKEMEEQYKKMNPAKWKEQQEKKEADKEMRQWWKEYKKKAGRSLVI